MRACAHKDTRVLLHLHVYWLNNILWSKLVDEMSNADIFTVKTYNVIFKSGHFGVIFHTVLTLGCFCNANIDFQCQRV